MPPTMQNVLSARTKQSRRNKCFECVTVGPIKLYFSHWELIAFESDKTDIVVCQHPDYVTAQYAPRDILTHRLKVEPDRSKWVTTREFTAKWNELVAIYFK